MDFRTPDRSRYPGHQPVRRQPVATVPVPPPRPEPVAQEPPAPKRRSRRLPAAKGLSWKKIAAIIIILGVISWLAYGYVTTKNQLENAKQSSASGSPSQQLVAKVGSIVQLPSETPQIYDVTDASKLKSQAFFSDAKNGDKVLFFPKSGQAVLYRPSTNKVIRYQPASLGGGTNGTSSTP